MAWEWLIAIDGMLGVGVFAIALLMMLSKDRTAATWFFAVAAAMATFRIFYFVLPALFEWTPTAGLVGIFPATEVVLGIALVGTALALRQDGFRPRSRRLAFLLLYLVGLAAILLLFVGDASRVVRSYFTPLFLATFFVASTGIVAIEWVRGGPKTPRRDLVLVLGPLFAWSLNDAIRVGHLALGAGTRSALNIFTVVVAAAWLVALIVIALLLARQIKRDGVGPRTRLLLGIVGVGVVLAMLQLFVADADGMRAVHLVLDCSAIIVIGIGVWNAARD